MNTLRKLYCRTFQTVLKISIPFLPYRKPRVVYNYCNNNITRLDVFVLCKLCTVLECNIEDLLVFCPPEKK